MAKSHRWGGTPEDWASLSMVAGLTEDLLPVVSNPGAKISPDSKLKTLGKVPSLYNSQGEAVGIANWVEKRTTHKDIDRWIPQSDYGICIQTRHLRAFDIDIDDEEFATRAVEIIAGVLNFGVPMPVRSRVNSKKILLAFYLEGDFTKRILKTEFGNIEFLAGGQQFIAVGTHPSGVYYQWHHPVADGMAPGLPADFPTLTREEFEACWAALAHDMGIEEAIEYGQGRTLKEKRRAVNVHDRVAEHLKANGWVKSTNRDGRLNIRCPFEHQHSGPSADDTATQYMPAGVGGFQQGHFHCLHAHCANRTDDEFIDATGALDTMFESIEHEIEPAKPNDPVPPPNGLTRNEAGRITITLSNLVTALRAGPWVGFEVGFDRFRDALMLKQGGSKSWREFTDADYTRVRLQLHAKGLRNAAAEPTKDALHLVAEENAFDSAQVWLTEVVPAWDGVPRVETFFLHAFGVPDEEYTRACGRYAWSALAGRVLEPGCKADMVPVLIGMQGMRKSETIAAIAPDRQFFTELDLSSHDDNMSRMMRGRLVAEFAELRGLHTKEREAIKAFITKRWENWVPKYREFATTFPRRCLFFGTGNDEMMLADTTGNRRWLPMVCQIHGSPEWVAENRLQLWAEGRALFLAEGVHFRDAEELAKVKHADHMITDSWEGPIGNWLSLNANGGVDPVKVGDVLHGALGIEARYVKRGDEMRCADVLKKLGLIRKKTRVGRETVWMWVKA